jgi:hypothetical protein
MNVCLKKPTKQLDVKSSGEESDRSEHSLAMTLKMITLLQQLINIWMEKKRNYFADAKVVEC